MQIYKTKKEKILKAIQIVYDILSAVFIVFVIVALAIGSNKGEKGSIEHLTPTIQESEKVSPKNAGYTDEYGHQYYYNTCEFFNPTFLDKMISYLVNKSEAYSDFSPASTNSISTHWAYSVNNNNSISGMFYYYDGGYLQYGLQVKWIEFAKTYIDSGTTSGGNEFLSSYYTLKFYDSSNLVAGNLIVSLRFDVLTPVLNHNEAEINGSLLYRVYGWSGSGINDSYFSNGVYMENDLDGVCLFHDLIDIDNETDYVEAYNNGYNAGRKAGYDKGYIDASEGVESNAFVVIGQAFEAVSGIFNINVLPNLPLWVLVFTPLIIAVVIVVVKLIKG